MSGKRCRASAGGAAEAAGARRILPRTAVTRCQPVCGDHEDPPLFYRTQQRLSPGLRGSQSATDRGRHSTRHRIWCNRCLRLLLVAVMRATGSHPSISGPDPRQAPLGQTASGCVFQCLFLDTRSRPGCSGGDVTPAHASSAAMLLDSIRQWLSGSAPIWTGVATGF